MIVKPQEYYYGGYTMVSMTGLTAHDDSCLSASDFDLNMMMCAYLYISIQGENKA